MARLLFLIQVSRPVVWPVLPLVYALGLHAARAPITAVAVVQMLMLTFPINLIGCGLNDIYDFESDRRCPRRRAIWGAVVGEDDRPLVFAASIAMAPLIVLSACFTLNWYNLFATMSLVLGGWLYSVPPIRIKERPPLDSLSNGVGYFLLPFVMGYSLGADPLAMPLRYLLLALAVAGVHAIATAADYDADRAAGHRTLATVFGLRWAAGAAFAAFFIAWIAGDFHSVAVRSYLAIGALATLIAAVIPSRHVIAGACVTIFAGFLVAGLAYIVAR